MRIVIYFLLFVFMSKAGYGQSFNDAMKSLSNHDYDKALVELEKVCKSGNIDACYNLGVLYANDPLNQGNRIAEIQINYPKALYFFTLSCDNNHGLGCNNLALMYGLGYGVEKNMTKHNQLREKACILNNGNACALMGRLYGQTKEYIDYKQALFFSQKACALKDACGCYDVGNLYFFGRGVPKDMDKVDYYTNLSEKYGKCKKKSSLARSSSGGEK